MKKKIRNFFETSMILVIVLAFVMPTVATITKPTLSEEILEMSDAEFEWIPTDASGSHTIVGNEIILHETGQLVTLEIQVSGWDPNLLKDSNGVGGTLNPLGWPGSPEDGCFINASRSDYVFYGMVQLDAVYTGDLNYMWGATLIVGTKTDDGQPYYFGTLILEIPTDASGTYTIDFIAGIDKTFMKDNNGQNILPIALTSALITINEPPNKPAKPSGQTNGKAGTPYTWVGPYASGAPGNASHAWTSQGSYNIQVKSKDAYDMESIWSDPLSVTMPKNKAFNFNFNLLSWLFERFPHAFPIIRHLLDL